MNQFPYDPALPVRACWALEFLPVCAAVVYVQEARNEHYCIASHAWMFESLADCIADARTRFPWYVDLHIIPKESEPKTWEPVFDSKQVRRVETVQALNDAKRIAFLHLLMARLNIDTAPRPWAPQGNNLDLIDSVNGYSVSESSTHADTFTNHIVPTKDIYLVRALEHYAVWTALHRTANATDSLDWSQRKRKRLKA